MHAPLIFFTGGGSAGHVTPNIALIETLRAENYDLAYIGSHQGIEARLISVLGIPYYAISTGKLRRHIDWRNLLMPLQVLQGIWQSYWLCRRHRPRVVFSKGGFVAVPVVLGAWLNRIPCITHESDLSPGLANRLVFPLAKRIALGFPQSARAFRYPNKSCYTGSPIRSHLFHGDAARARQHYGFDGAKPILFVYGGGLGSVHINQALWAALPLLLPRFYIIHACGRGKVDPSFDQVGYCQCDYIGAELADILAAADVVVSRAGANSIAELLALAKPHLLIPLSKQASRGDQLENAAYYQGLGLSSVLLEADLNTARLVAAIEQLWLEREAIIQNLRAHSVPDAQAQLLALIKAEIH